MKLDLVPATPINSPSTRWRMVRWSHEAIVEETVQPVVAGRIIWFHGRKELDYPKSLQPLVGWDSDHEYWDSSWDIEREYYRGRIVDEVNRLLNGPLSPTQPFPRRR